MYDFDFVIYNFVADKMVGSVVVACAQGLWMKNTMAPCLWMGNGDISFCEWQNDLS